MLHNVGRSRSECITLSNNCLVCQWCETQKECNRLRLVDILVQPMQRLTKYSLLLKAILKKTDQQEHRWKLQEMVRLCTKHPIVVTLPILNSLINNINIVLV